MCEQKAEVNNHLFIHGKAASKLWNMFLCILGVSWVMPNTTMELFNSWTRIGNRGKVKTGGRLAPCIWWTLWKKKGMLGVLKDKMIVLTSLNIDSCGMVDIGQTGSKYTRCNNWTPSKRIWKRLNRVFINSLWAQNYNQRYQRCAKHA
ncbi:hypothetical protein MTR67_008741 [Solanum verrucosum]|uniref:Uncharacterized protein n=1 Tax=Solanum verrucosum TaxID=315347 RepID=A0AAF0Q7H9_SOLVR|nr:hypothetical protein MTR67_008741 [Solanum verrucosum]